MKRKITAIVTAIIITIAIMLTLNSEASSNVNSSSTVYICPTENAKTYHDNKECYGLNRCSITINTVDLDYIKKYRRECKICYK